MVYFITNNYGHLGVSENGVYHGIPPNDNQTLGESWWIPVDFDDTKLPSFFLKNPHCRHHHHSPHLVVAFHVGYISNSSAFLLGFLRLLQWIGAFKSLVGKIGTGNHGFSREIWGFSVTLWNTNITIESHHAINGKTHYEWPFSIAMFNYQRVIHVETVFFMGKTMV